MTAQSGEKLIYNDEEFFIASEPLNEYLYTKGIRFSKRSTCCWRGYIGKWEIKDKKLYLSDLTAWTDGKEVGVDYLFPGQKEVFAEWFSGEIRIPQGNLLLYVHVDYDSIYEEDLFLTFEKGCLTGSKIEDNRNKELVDPWDELIGPTPGKQPVKETVSSQKVSKKSIPWYSRLFKRR